MKVRIGTTFTTCAVASRRSGDGRAAAVLFVVCVSSTVATVADLFANTLESDVTCGTCGNVPHAPEPADLTVPSLIGPVTLRGLACEPRRHPSARQAQMIQDSFRRSSIFEHEEGGSR
jgi:hypothetical protein